MLLHAEAFLLITGSQLKLLAVSTPELIVTHSGASVRTNQACSALRIEKQQFGLTSCAKEAP